MIRPPVDRAAVGKPTQYRLPDRTQSDRDVAVPETRRLQQSFQNRVEELSFDARLPLN